MNVQFWSSLDFDALQGGLLIFLCFVFLITHLFVSLDFLPFDYTSLCTRSSFHRTHLGYLQYKRTRQIIRYRVTATLRRPQIKQNTASNEGGGDRREHRIILTKYEACTLRSFRKFLIRDANNFDKGIITMINIVYFSIYSLLSFSIFFILVLLSLFYI